MKRDAGFKKAVFRAARRVVLSKLNYFKGGNAVPLFPDINAIKKNIPNPRANAFFTTLAARAITLYRGGIFPYAPEKAATERILAAGQFQDFFLETSRRYEQTRYFFFGYTLDAEQIREKAEELAFAAKNSDTVIFCVANDVSRRVARNAAAILKGSGKKLIVISVLEPVHVLDFDWADTILLAYSYSPFSFRAALSALAGDYTPHGRLPLDIRKSQ